MRAKKTPDTKSEYTVEQLLGNLPSKGSVAAVPPEAGMDEILAAFDRARHSRTVYVASVDHKLQGSISLGDIVRHVFFNYHEQDAHTPVCSVISIAAAEHARDFMYPNPIVARGSDSVAEVIPLMLKHRLKEIPVVDEIGRVFADLTMVDLLRTLDLWGT